MERQQQNYLLSWAHQNQCGIKTIEELRHALLHTTMELEQTRMVASEELITKDDQIMQLKDLLNKAIKEKDEAQERYKRLLLDQHFILQRQTDEEQDPNINGFHSSDGEESIVSSFEPPMEIEIDFPEMTLPEKGKLLKAVVKAGPLLQTLLLAGQLPQWRHPPPQLESFEIPPVIIAEASPLSQDSCGNNLNRKRVHCDESDSKRETKYQRLLP
ncbi:hypothetical protein ISN45_Aa04g011510 [Arabidopsis thaliana x Arabidopsis arenosa]|uniref:Uncharacterized protein n=1 Tax=Arabidopsis thaliana x Arabidopsis arenosa TaxID=1240361 RepID=A0A8T2A8E8_9BRAS|nr:hypothetical protein ISN45_Aa04g011510 [Arabidopsis thaliana x Arabidopsis arenosa]